jgi:hypothetical protein
MGRPLVLGIERSVPLDPDRDLRTRVGPRHPWVAWAARVGLALVFAIGMLSAGGGKLKEAEYEPQVEVAEDIEVAARNGRQARVVRRTLWSWRDDCRPPVLVRPRAPQQLEPSVPTPSRPCWQRPRRAPPPDEDDDMTIG